MNQVQTPDGMLTVAEFLATYKIASTKFYAEVADGRLKAVKCGRRTYVRRSAAEEWADALPDFNEVTAKHGARHLNGAA